MGGNFLKYFKAEMWKQKSGVNVMVLISRKHRLINIFWKCCQLLWIKASAKLKNVVMIMMVNLSAESQPNCAVMCLIRTVWGPCELPHSLHEALRKMSLLIWRGSVEPANQSPEWSSAKTVQILKSPHCQILSDILPETCRDLSLGEALRSPTNGPWSG